MKIRSFSLLCSLSLGLWMVSIHAHAADTVFMQIASIDGTALEANHINWHPIKSMSWNVERPVDMSNLQSPTAYQANVAFSKFMIERVYDHTSPEFFLAVAQGVEHAEIKIEFTQDNPAGSGPLVPYLTVYLREAYIDKLTQEADSEGVPTETISIAYKKIVIETQRVEGMTMVPGESANWDLVTGTTIAP